MAQETPIEPEPRLSSEARSILTTLQEKNDATIRLMETPNQAGFFNVVNITQPRNPLLLGQVPRPIVEELARHGLLSAVASRMDSKIIATPHGKAKRENTGSMPAMYKLAPAEMGEQK